MTARIVRNTAAALALLLALSACADADKGASQPREMSGQELYQHWCADCHDAGPGHPGTLRIAGRGGEEHAALLQKEINAEVVEYAVRSGFGMMPPFRLTEISDEELDRLTEYLVKKQ